MQDPLQNQPCSLPGWLVSVVVAPGHPLRRLAHTHGCGERSSWSPVSSGEAWYWGLMAMSVGRALL